MNGVLLNTNVVLYMVRDDAPVPNVNVLAFVFMQTLLWGMGAIPYVSGMLLERDVYYRERQVGAYRVLPYFAMKV